MAKNETYLTAVGNAMKHLELPRKGSSASLMKNIQEKKLKDVGGYDEAKLEIIEFINFVNHKQRYLSLGARLPRGALLHGPSGIGKTLLIKAACGEGNIPYLSCSSASLLVDPKGVEKLRKVFKVAKQLQPCVLFFDEIDIITMSRSNNESKAASFHLTDEMLTQLDGFQKDDRDKEVIIFGATNAFSDIDKALLRPGRFDRVIEMPEPDLDARKEIAKIHLARVKTSLDKTNLATMIALLTEDSTGASVAAVCNEAAMIAARDLSEEIKMEHFNQGIDRVRCGLKKKRTLSDKEKLIAAYHEAGHAVIAWHLPGVQLVNRLSILPNPKGDFVCCTKNRTPKEGIMNRQELINTLVVIMSGLAAEETVFGQYAGTGAVDLEWATIILLNMATQNGHFPSVGKVLFKSAFQSAIRCYYNEKKFACGDKITELCFNEMKTLISEVYETAKAACVKYRDQVDNVANFLSKRNFMSLEDMQTVLGPHSSFSVKKLSRAESLFVLPPSLQAWNVSD